jgi:hypothetical protein
MDVSNVGKFSLKAATFEFLKEFTVERNLMDVSNVGMPMLIPVTFVLVKEPILKRNYGCKQREKGINQCIHLHEHRRAHTLCIYAM